MTGNNRQIAMGLKPIAMGQCYAANFVGMATYKFETHWLSKIYKLRGLLVTTPTKAEVVKTKHLPLELLLLYKY
jgi:hypothetical protein